jgi:large subunit ribosomal protein L32e
LSDLFLGGQSDSLETFLFKSGSSDTARLMIINKDLLQARKKISDKRPKFVRQESWRYDRLSPNWRRPKGKDNKMRLQVSGVPCLVKIGYRGPKSGRGLHPSGYIEVMVFNKNDLGGVDPTRDAIRIGHTVGRRKREVILEEASKMKIKVLNPHKAKIEKLDKVEKVNDELKSETKEANS